MVLSLSFLSQFLSKPEQSLLLRKVDLGGIAKVALSLTKRGKSTVIVVQNAIELATLKAILHLFSAEESFRDTAVSQAHWESSIVVMPQHPAGNKGVAAWAERMAALYSLRSGKNPRIVVTTVDNLLLRLPPVSIFDVHQLELNKNMEIPQELIVEQAIDWGYVRVPMVSVPGDISVRGDIVDIFCPGYNKPVRLEFFGDLLEELRLFDPATQRSIASLNECTMLPVAPVIASKQLMAAATAFWQKEIKRGVLKQEDLAGLLRLLEGGGSGMFSGCFYPEASFWESWVSPDSVYITPDAERMNELLQDTAFTIESFLEKEQNVTSVRQPFSLVLRTVDETQAFLKKQANLQWSILPIGLDDPQSYDLPEKTYHTFQDIFIHKASQERPWQYLIASLKAWAPGTVVTTKTKSGKNTDEAPEPSLVLEELIPAPQKNRQLLLSFSSERSRKKFLELVGQEGIFPYERYTPEQPGIYTLISPFRKGFALPWEGIIVLGEDLLQPKVERARQLPREVFQGLERYDTLQDGDYLVHRDYGLGIFAGLHRMELGGVAGDYLLLRYAEDAKLYLPVDRLGLVQRFKGGEGMSPVPDRLGGNQWAASKEKAKKAIEKIAADLVSMYALRKVVKGFRYSPLSEMYREFEASFGFEETPDQTKAIDDVLQDMDKAEPMDRLICGDVGFGKTEVALRAAFRAAVDGRQVAFLCPTTILAEQHYQTFRTRLAGFPLNVGLLSRFVPKKKQTEILAATAKGQIDILIGTHRLLSKDVVFPHLGLLVLDEEQRFGVRHKERLKEMRKNVDALTLTATPIPRTLQLSLSGIRELSVIETPPLERKPVVTALVDKNDDALRTIIERELEREGQVFWVYNRVQGLERAVDYVKKLVPHARVGIAHGQLPESQLEETMRQFWVGELDVLVATSIIESGLDFPRANTLIVDQAQLFGLGQLYQLRGRVGRSDRQAFAVFIVPEVKRLSEIARQRLRIILEMDYLGAGFQVAMEDLRIRGAGNILGETQSGHMNRLGLDLFLEMLEEAVAKVKGEPLPMVAETEITIGVPAFIPESYMADSKERLRYYKILSSAASNTELQDIMLEIKDRFGATPEELKNFIAVLDLKRNLTDMDVEKADLYPDKLRLSFSAMAKIQPERLVAFIAEQEEKGLKIKLQPPAILELPLAPERPLAESFAVTLALLEPIMYEKGRLRNVSVSLANNGESFIQ